MTRLMICSYILLSLLQVRAQAPGDESKRDYSLVAPAMNIKPLPFYDYENLDYGMNMGIEKSSAKRLWSCWTAGGDDPSSFMVVIKSDDGGKKWGSPVLVIDAQDARIGEKRAVQNGNLWLDPLGRLWLFFDQSMHDFDGRAGVWFSRCDNPNEKNPRWTSPQRLWHGTAKSKPIVLSTGEWILPISLLNRQIIDKDKEAHHELDSFRMAHVFISADSGRSWHRQGGVRFPNASYDEHHVIQRKDGTLWMTARTDDGICESVSIDKGINWSQPKKYLQHISSRHFIRRLQSGNILLVKHGALDERTKTRSKLMAFLSDDEGKTWKGGLLIDERRGVSYPDGFQSTDGTIYVSYDRNRDTDGHILLARFTEEDVMDKEFRSPVAKSKKIIAQPQGIDKVAPPSNHIHK